MSNIHCQNVSTRKQDQPKIVQKQTRGRKKCCGVFYISMSNLCLGWKLFKTIRLKKCQHLRSHYHKRYQKHSGVFFIFFMLLFFKMLFI